jgi:putative CocE/NonD family hydrolase
MVEERWKTTRTWPLPNERRVNWYFSPNGTLTRRPPVQKQGLDTYTVNFEVSNQRLTRWLPGTLLDPMYPDRAAQDRLALTYTTEPVRQAIEITGHPVVTLYVTSTATDGLFIVYLEDVAPSGKVTYITEGTLRAVHREVSPDPPHKMLIPYHSYRRRDGLPLRPGEIAELRFGLLPTSVLVKQGHSLRVSIAGADKNGFERVPETDIPTISILRNRLHASSIELPLISK